MKILATERELPLAEEKGFTADILRLEAERAWQLYKEGTFREIYFTKEDHLAVIVMECGSREEASGILRSLPLVEAGLIDFDIKTLVPYDGFSRLFSDS